MGADIFSGAATAAFVAFFLGREKVHLLQLPVEPVNMRVHWVPLVTGAIPFVQLSSLADLDADYPGTFDRSGLFVHCDLGRFLPPANEPPPVLVKTHRHG